MFCGDLEGWNGCGETPEGKDICTHITDSLHCTQKVTQHCKATIPQLKKERCIVNNLYHEQKNNTKCDILNIIF